MSKNQMIRNLKIKAIAGLTLILFGCVASINAQQKTEKINSLMWKATKGKNTAYLLGSVHLGSTSFYPLPKEIEDAFEQATVLLVEFDVTKVDALGAQALIQKNGVYQGDDILWKHVSSSTAEEVKKFCAEYSLPAEALAKVKPWVLAIMASVIPMQKQGLDPNLGIDKYFLDKAKNKKRVQEIETAEWQMTIFSALPEDQQEIYLQSSLKQSASVKDLVDSLQTAWLQGDAKQLETLIGNSAIKPAELQKRLLDDRNPKMTDAAEQCLKGSDQCFMVVGAAHLIGKKGVVQLLKDRGYNVEQISVMPTSKEKSKPGS